MRGRLSGVIVHLSIAIISANIKSLDVKKYDGTSNGMSTIDRSYVPGSIYNTEVAYIGPLKETMYMVCSANQEPNGLRIIDRYGYLKAVNSPSNYCFRLLLLSNMGLLSDSYFTASREYFFVQFSSVQKFTP